MAVFWPWFSDLNSFLRLETCPEFQLQYRPFQQPPPYVTASGPWSLQLSRAVYAMIGNTEFKLSKWVSESVSESTLKKIFGKVVSDSWPKTKSFLDHKRTSQLSSFWSFMQKYRNEIFTVMQAGFEISKHWLTPVTNLAYSLEMMFKAAHSRNGKSSFCFSERLYRRISLGININACHSEHTHVQKDGGVLESNLITPF